MSVGGQRLKARKSCHKNSTRSSFGFWDFRGARAFCVTAREAVFPAQRYTSRRAKLTGTGASIENKQTNKHHIVETAMKILVCLA